MEESKKILIVEDEAIHAMYLKILLKNSGYDITGTEGTGEGAIASVEQNQPDLALMDITLRNSIDGLEVANILRKKYIFPIIFISGYDDDDTLSRIETISNTWKLTKPIEDTTLTDLIREIFDDSVKVTD
ncbi:MAG: CheY-like chemotaxis protein [Marivirga sp.]|jgi:CheY-like chemotaxis protein